MSLPTISGNLGGSANQATWVITSFAVSTAIALPLTGWLARRFGERKLFMWSTLGFVFASFLCGLAHSMGLLVTARALQGLLAGPMYPVTQALLLSIYPPAKRGQAIALLAMVTVVAPIAGPILGGWITDNYSWEDVYKRQQHDALRWSDQSCFCSSFPRRRESSFLQLNVLKLSLIHI